MKKQLTFLFAACFLLFCFVIQAQNNNNEIYQPGKIWFKIKSTVNISSAYITDDGKGSLPKPLVVSKVERICGVKKISNPYAYLNVPELAGVYQLEIADNVKINDVLEMLLIDPSVEYAERVPLDKTFLALPNDPSYNTQWELGLINAPIAWASVASLSSVLVAVVDDGVQTNHPDLNIYSNTLEASGVGSADDDGNGYVDDINGYDVADDDNNPYQAALTHGTKVAGVLAANTNNGVGIACVSYGSKVLPVKVAKDNSPAGVITHGYDGIIYAAVSGAKVICVAWGSPVSTITGQQIINYAHSKGCVIIAAAGNDNSNNMYYPAAYNNVIAVAATQSNDVKAPFSNYGSWIDVSAPGVNVYTTNAGSGFVTAGGTSIAAGITAGLASLMYSLRPGATPADIEACLKLNSVNINSLNPTFTNMLGDGRIDASSALSNIVLAQYSSPIADFDANVTTVYAGSKVTFINKSAHSPTSYTWTFQGGNPSSSFSASPGQITYSTPGTYSVSLRAVNSFGNDTETKLAYINVIAGNQGCDTIHWNYSPWRATPPTWSPNVYTYPDAAATGGHMHGLNNLNHKEIAQLFGISGNKRNLYKLTVSFARLGSPTDSIASRYIKVKVYGVDSITRQPVDIGNPITTIPLTSITKPGATIIRQTFKIALSQVPGTGIVGVKPDSFFVSIAMSGGGTNEGNLLFNNSSPGLGDTLALLGSSYLLPDPPALSLCWIKKSNNSWCHNAPSTGCTPWAFAGKSAMYLFPHLTDIVPEADIVTSDDTICEGSYVVYDATGSTFVNSLSWTFPGGQPSSSIKAIDTVYYINNTSSPVQHQAKLVVTGGDCALLADTSYYTITVNPNPVITLTTSPGNVICTGTSSSVTVTASGASSYSWSPANGLSSTTGNSVTASPTSTQTYEVAAISAEGCYGAAGITVVLDTMPIASALVYPTFICPGEQITLDASLSKNVSSFSWTAPGSSSLTASSAYNQITYTAYGTYTVSLIVTNNCGADSTFSQVITVGCQGISDLFSEAGINVIYNSYEGAIHITVNNQYGDQRVKMQLIDMLGKKIITEQKNINTGIVNFGYDVSALARGTYLLVITNDSGNEYSKKIVIY